MQANEASLPAPDPGNTAARLEHQQISQNTEAVLDFYAREEQRVTRSQRLLEWISLLIGQPAFLGFTLASVATWMLASFALSRAGIAAFDAPPFFWLQGIIGLGALMSAIVVLSRQSRLATLAEQRNSDQVLAALDEPTAHAQRVKLGGEDENGSSGGTR